MSKIKIYELAKQIDKQSKDIVTFLKENNVDVKNHMSNIEDNQVDMVKKHFSTKHVEKKIIEKDKNLVVKQPTNTQESVKTSNNSHANGLAQVNRDNRPAQSNPTSRPAQSNPTNRPAQSNPTNRPTQSNTTNRPTQSNTTNRPSYNNTTNRPSYNNTTNRPAQSNPTNRPTQSNTTNRPTQSNTTNRPSYNNTTNRPVQNNSGNRPTQSNNMNRTGQNQTNRPAGDSNNRTTQGNNYNRPTQTNNNTRPGQNTQGNNSNRTGQANNNKQTGNSNNRYGQGNKSGQGNYRNKNNRNNHSSVSNKDPNRKGAFIMPKPQIQAQEVDADGVRTIIIPEVLTIKELADKMKIPAAVVVKKLFLAGKMVSINQEILFEEAEEIALEYNCITELEEKVNVIEELLKEEEEDTTKLKKRPPVVCVMGHVDHGKTSLLDAIKETNVISREAGGITQHIGAYVVEVNGEKITFLDTPGHEAFTSMRMRGAQSTDIAILVVAADDGVMPQTVEAINHAKAAGIEIIVAINKIDKPSANIERVKQELVEHELIAEDWGGDTIFVPVSAHTKEGLDQLLDMILLTAEILELKANPDRNARGVVIEAQLDKGRGPVATILVQKGVLHVGDSLAIGAAYGKVRALMDDKGKRVKEAYPSTPVEILGLNDVPDAGETLIATDNEKESRSIAEAYIKQGREKLLDDTKAKLSLDGLFSQIQAGNIKELNLVVKADVQGSVEAVKQSLLKLSNEEVAIRIIHGGVGAINESDVILASASNAIIIGFNVRPDNTAKETADHEKVDLRLYRVIYNAIEDIEAAMKGMLDPTFAEKVIGHAEVRQVFKASGLGTIAGSYVLDGKIVRNSSVRIIRENIVIFDGALASLKRFKDDVKEVASGYECGLVFEKYNDVKEGDNVEIYIMEEIPR